jgi:hypothetical protein
VQVHRHDAVIIFSPRLREDLFEIGRLPVAAGFINEITGG